jgi:hypothetical protein
MAQFNESRNQTQQEICISPASSGKFYLYSENMHYRRKNEIQGDPAWVLSPCGNGTKAIKHFSSLSLAFHPFSKY